MIKFTSHVLYPRFKKRENLDAGINSGESGRQPIVWHRSREVVLTGGKRKASFMPESTEEQCLQIQKHMGTFAAISFSHFLEDELSKLLL